MRQITPTVSMYPNCSLVVILRIDSGDLPSCNSTPLPLQPQHQLLHCLDLSRMGQQCCKSTIDWHLLDILSNRRLCPDCFPAGTAASSDAVPPQSAANPAAAAAAPAPPPTATTAIVVPPTSDAAGGRFRAL